MIHSDAGECQGLLEFGAGCCNGGCKGIGRVIREAAE